jgi:flavin-dependent dehydrogenase
MSDVCSCNVVIAGSGIAAAAIAIRLCDLGFRPLVLSAPRRMLPGIEAIPDTALCLFQELRITHVLEEAGASLVDGFENHWHPQKPVLRAGRWAHVDRARLADAAIKEAVRRGTVIRNCASLPVLTFSEDGVSLVHETDRLFFCAAIDATGRSAVWSRPIRHYCRSVADIFASKTETRTDSRAKVIRFSDHWAYRLGLGSESTVALISADRSRRKLDPTTRLSLELRSEFSYVGRRPAFPQWCDQPIYRRRVAIGDAALAHDPISGLGIRFALSSALAAASVLNTWRDARLEDGATEYYRQFIAQCRQRHLRFLQELTDGDGGSKQIGSSLPDSLNFSAKTMQGHIQVAGCVLPDEVVALADGTFVRWIGGIDLLDIRKLAARPVRTTKLLQELTRGANAPSHASSVLAWCVQHGILQACNATPGGVVADKPTQAFPTTRRMESVR